ncbi:hypothetical protein KCM76_12225 [Zooshikella marina]|uniref:hypothetical protein n=1 Tax=Zooshikella ganghwensis TaxID=202772 RepID=UPI001BAF4E2E|nr:hypothetical protein [Zooshikella ganghwensis]MBU2706751.1 hypothetical protein [Zooshikella ganghwensis]
MRKWILCFLMGAFTLSSNCLVASANLECDSRAMGGITICKLKQESLKIPPGFSAKAREGKVLINVKYYDFNRYGASLTIKHFVEVEGKPSRVVYYANDYFSETRASENTSINVVNDEDDTPPNNHSFTLKVELPAIPACDTAIYIDENVKVALYANVMPLPKLTIKHIEITPFELIEVDCGV